MYSQANTIRSYEKIHSIVRGGPIPTFFLLVGILGGVMLADCWGNIPTTQELLQMQAQKSNGDMYLCLQRQLNPLSKSTKTGQVQLKTTVKTSKTVAQLRHQQQNEKLRKRIQARKAFLKEKRKCKVAKVLFLASLSKPSNRQ